MRYAHPLICPINEHCTVDTLLESSSSLIELFDDENVKRDPKMLVLDAVLLTDVSVICISSSCCDLRFYDTSNTGHSYLRLYIRNFPASLNAFDYHSYHDDEGECSGRLIFGDFVGSVRVIDFTKHFAKHFRSGTVIRQISYEELMEVNKTR
jgi:hypothetical protein